MRVITIATPLFLTGCASAQESAPGRNDTQFERIAAEWQGADITDMIHVWRVPRLPEQDEKSGGAGTATWAIFGAYTDRRMRCEEVAHFDEHGLIHDIDVVRINCPPKRRVSRRENWNIEQLRRPSPVNVDTSAAGDDH